MLQIQPSMKAAVINCNKPTATAEQLIQSLPQKADAIVPHPGRKMLRAKKIRPKIAGHFTIDLSKKF